MMIRAGTVVELHAVSPYHQSWNGWDRSIPRCGSLFPIGKETANFHIIIHGDIA